MALLKMKGVSFLLIFLLTTSFTYSIENLKVDQNLTTKAAYYFPDQEGYKLNGDYAPISYKVIKGDLDNGERNIGSSWGGVELIEEYKLSLTMDVLQGESFLTKSNKVAFSFKGKLSPITVGVEFEVLFTPIAFIDIFVGSSNDAGWYGAGVVGLGLNDKGTTPSKGPLQGVLTQNWVGGTFKFDLAAVLPGDDTWKHIVLLSSHKLLFRSFNIAEENEAWVFQGRDGFNGIQYKQTTLLGYQMPLILETAGIIVETTADVSKHKDFDNDFVECRFGGLFNLKINENHSLAILPQFTTKQRYTDETIKEEYFNNREVDSTSPVFIDFERIAFVYSYKF